MSDEELKRLRELAKLAPESEVKHAILALLSHIDKKAKEAFVLEGVIAMAVDRLGGKVDAKPTHEGNFLQRIDEMRAHINQQAKPIRGAEAQRTHSECHCRP